MYSMGVGGQLGIEVHKQQQRKALCNMVPRSNKSWTEVSEQQRGSDGQRWAWDSKSLRSAYSSDAGLRGVNSYRLTINSLGQQCSEEAEQRQYSRGIARDSVSMGSRALQTTKSISSAE